MAETNIDWISPLKNLVICLFLWTGLFWIPGCVSNSFLVESAVEGAISWAKLSEDVAKEDTRINAQDEDTVSKEANEESDSTGGLGSFWRSTTNLATTAKNKTVAVASGAYEGTTGFLGEGVQAVHSGIYNGAEFFLRALLKIFVWILAAGFLAFRGYIKFEEFIGSVFVDFLPSLFKR